MTFPAASQGAVICALVPAVLARLEHVISHSSARRVLHFVPHKSRQDTPCRLLDR
jgi:hypothetical protein